MLAIFSGVPFLTGHRVEPVHETPRVLGNLAFDLMCAVQSIATESGRLRPKMTSLWGLFLPDLLGHLPAPYRLAVIGSLTISSCALKKPFRLVLDFITW